MEYLCKYKIKKSKTHICRFKNHANDPDPSLVLINDERICVQSLQIRFIRIVDVRHYDGTVDGLQERDQSLDAVIELVISDGLVRVIDMLHNHWNYCLIPRNIYYSP